MTSLLSTGKKKQKASRVFGEVFYNDVEGSLNYSPSPAPTKAKELLPDDIDTNPIPTNLFGSGKSDSLSKSSISVMDDKENSAVNTSTKSVSEKLSPVQSIRSSELNRLRASARSPQHRDMVKRTQDAINQATSSISKTLVEKEKNTNSKSINQSLNATKKARDAIVRERSNKSKNVRFQWEEQNNETKSFYEKVEDQRRQILAVQRKLASAHFKAKARNDGEKRKQEIAELEKDYMFNSDVYRNHQERLKAERDKKRKMSMDARAKLRQNKREGEEKLDAKRREEEEAIFDVKYDLHRARNEAARAAAEARRKSLQGRGQNAKRVKETEAEILQEIQETEHASFELKRGAAKDVDAYKKKMADDRRDSFKKRGAAARNVREEQKKQAHAAMLAEHESYELKFAGERDADAYRKKMREERRQSLANRNKESARHAEVMQELRSIAQEKEAESFMLKFAGENDAKDYMAQLAEDRRKSLQFRGKEAMRQRQYENEQHAKEVENALAEAALQSQCQKDVENYKKECSEKRRLSLQYRAKEAKLRRMETEDETQKQQEAHEESFALESLARMDVEEYMKDCRKQRRKSLACRAKEKRRHAKWRQEQREMEIEERARTSHYKSLDAQHIALAQQQERARIAMDALRSAGCSIKGNPFGDLLKL